MTKSSVMAIAVAFVCAMPLHAAKTLHGSAPACEEALVLEARPSLGPSQREAIETAIMAIKNGESRFLCVDATKAGRIEFLSRILAYQISASGLKLHIAVLKERLLASQLAQQIETLQGQVPFSVIQWGDEQQSVSLATLIVEMKVSGKPVLLISTFEALSRKIGISEIVPGNSEQYLGKLRQSLGTIAFDGIQFDGVEQARFLIDSLFNHPASKTFLFGVTAGAPNRDSPLFGLFGASPRLPDYSRSAPTDEKSLPGEEDAGIARKDVVLIAPSREAKEPTKQRDKLERSIKAAIAAAELLNAFVQEHARLPSNKGEEVKFYKKLLRNSENRAFQDHLSDDAKKLIEEKSKNRGVGGAAEKLNAFVAEKGYFPRSEFNDERRFYADFIAYRHNPHFTSRLSSAVKKLIEERQKSKKTSLMRPYAAINILRAAKELNVFVQAHHRLPRPSGKRTPQEESRLYNKVYRYKYNPLFRKTLSEEAERAITDNL